MVLGISSSTTPGSVGPVLTVNRSSPRICLAASGGGHIRQILDLEAFWSRYSYFLVSEDSALSRSLARTHPVHFVKHFAFGQARQGAFFRMLLGAVVNCCQSARIMLRERPDVVVSTGAGAVYFSVLWARLLGAQFVLIETLARFDEPSLFWRMTQALANLKIVQSPVLAAKFSDAALFDPVEILSKPRPPKRPLVFVTVGATLPFDRLVKMVAELKARGDIPEGVVIQTGIGGYAPPGIEAFEALPFEAMLAYLRDADIVICHGGTGSIITALREGCRTIVVPRLFDLGEHYDDHQAEITQAFAGRGLVTPASSLEELSTALKTIRARAPVCVSTDHSRLVEYLSEFISESSVRNPVDC